MSTADQSPIVKTCSHGSRIYQCGRDEAGLAYEGMFCPAFTCATTWNYYEPPGPPDDVKDAFLDCYWTMRRKAYEWADRIRERRASRARAREAEPVDN
jgi:hypothetical protein